MVGGGPGTTTGETPVPLVPAPSPKYYIKELSMQQIPVARPTLGEEEAAAARRAIMSGWVVQGPEVAAFEEEFAALVGAPLAVACSSGTAALHLALLALDLAPGDEVITVSHSFIATANAVRYVGATPVFVDVELNTGNLNAELIGRPRGDLATFSFHPRKIITTGDGGMITGRDSEIMARLGRLRSHAMSLSTEERHRTQGIVFE